MSSHDTDTPTASPEDANASGQSRVDESSMEEDKTGAAAGDGDGDGAGAAAATATESTRETATADSAQSKSTDDTDDQPKPYDPFDDPEGLDEEEQKKEDDDDHKETIDASVATLKPPLTPLAALSLSPTSASTYVDPTPATPLTTSHPPSRSPSNAASHRSDADADEDRRYLSDDDNANTASSGIEIQTIMEQFSGDGGGPGEEEVMSPRLEIAAPMLAPTTTGTSGTHPPRKSSLEPLAPGLAQHIKESVKAMPDESGGAGAAGAAGDDTEETTADKGEGEDRGPPVPPKDGAEGGAAAAADAATSGTPSAAGAASTDDTPLSPTVSLHRPPPPAPEPEPVLPFDFHRFLEQLRHKKADPVARYLKSFLSEFAKKQWMVHEQVKIISDFLAFIANKMAVCEVWRDLSDAEFDNAREGMEKLVMNRLYSQTFSPAIPPPQPIPGAKPKRRGGERPMGPGRRGQHQEDVERDEVLSQKITIYGWVRERHLDIAPVEVDSSRRFLRLAQQELLKIKSYRAPRDKIICVLNCCKVIFGLLKHNKADESADSFMPLLIYVVLQANPDHLVSNVQYILRFRNQDKLGGEAGYYLSSLMGAVQFIENMDRTTLTITDEEFEQNVEAAVSAIAERHRAASPPLPIPPEDQDGETAKEAAPSKTGDSLQPPGEPSTPRRSADSDRPRTPRSPRAAPPKSGDEADQEGDDDDDAEKDVVTGLLRTIQRPLSTIGRLFSEEPAEEERGRTGGEGEGTPAGGPRRQLSAEEAAARQASAETAEAQRLHRVEHANIVETLAGMFPDLDRDIISDVVYQKEGRVGLAVDACLALSQ
ncbi:hypothetical protein Sste5346_006419 [Sporothrix stenoceras]|uniref:Guanine nucleotide exchange factor n=1 Tax=Sporothrix stenoceras TaxID=5173 RepID=A0ABR3YYZ3_9PEZI